MSLFDSKIAQDVLGLFGMNQFDLLSNANFKGPRHAQDVFGMGGNLLDRIPRHKFLFFVRFIRPDATGGPTPYGNWRDGVSFAVKRVDRPGVRIEYETVNQYNKKRNIQKTLEYKPITLSFHDTYDERVHQMMQEYLSYYYADSRKLSADAWFYDVVEKDFLDFGDGWGYNPPAVNGQDANFFQRMEIYQFGGGRFTRWDVVHPKIVDFSPDNHDYADGSTPSEIMMTIAYEGIVWQPDGVMSRSAIPPDLAQLAGLEQADPLHIIPTGWTRPGETKPYGAVGQAVDSIFGSSFSQASGPLDFISEVAGFGSFLGIGSDTINTVRQVTTAAGNVSSRILDFGTPGTVSNPNRPLRLIEQAVSELQGAGITQPEYTAAMASDPSIGQGITWIDRDSNGVRITPSAANSFNSKNTTQQIGNMSNPFVRDNSISSRSINQHMTRTPSIGQDIQWTSERILE